MRRRLPVSGSSPTFAQLGTNAPFLLMVAFTALVFALGGASRSDVLSLVVLRPLSVIACGYGLAMMTPDQWRQYRLPLALGFAALVLVAVQLVPLPPALWQALPGHAIVAEADSAAGLGPVWRPISMAPDMTWNSLFALATPFAAATMMIALPSRSSRRMSWVLLTIGLISGLLGILQLIGPADSSLYFYDTTNIGSAVGLFANRNHAAVFLGCLFPILALLAANGERHQQIIAVAAAIFVVPLIVVTGSRAGIVMGVLGIALAAVMLFFTRSRHPSAQPAPRRRYLLPLVAMCGLVLVILAAVWSHSGAWERFLSSGQAGEKRLQAWPFILRVAGDYAPFGSGYGTFDVVYRAGEPTSLLSPSYLNHAHNDWLELGLTGGIAGIALLGAALGAFVFATIRVWRGNSRHDPDVPMARVGSLILLMLALASIVDYPLRTPSLSLLAAVAGVWLARGYRRVNHASNRQKTLENAVPSG